MEKRIIQLEGLAAMQDNTILELNAEVFRQQQDITRLIRRIERLEEKLRELEGPDEIAGQEKPPHW
ncbi:MAG: SlyX family protein [Pontiellaceae bacterium]|nr:SlyX family protein [Pontiellaceae bacterium]MBN2783285.1 SlyX family protein [Pontiellaceae bacterium]